MNFEYLNKMVLYIENNLDNVIDLNELSKIANINLFILERIFMFLTGMTLSQYIKKRRLSKAFEEIRDTDKKIIDIAFKYQYNSQVSFNRAFKQCFGISPSECRRGIGEYQVMPIRYFGEPDKDYNLNYQIKEIEETTLYCYQVIAENNADLLYKIRKLYKNLKKDDSYNKLSIAGMYGIYFEDNGKYHYYIGSKVKDDKLEKFVVSKNKYAIFKLESRWQSDIDKMEHKIIKEWNNSTNYDINEKLIVEYYVDDFCYIMVPLK